ncbi:hypothetical protein BGW38_008782 [Lunasporangiospora selenospora]|uniref:VASt domain-containing protein n=1 Tax=Lunasporangiospora selenospora TaxID=979761 RepID=A0A9P6FYF3_9FUNG|nr:hypothetical protein BGW38_008782 [Lunasporangiospora selenospora]
MDRESYLINGFWAAVVKRSSLQHESSQRQHLGIAFSEITAIEKRLTAFVIPNAISIVTTSNPKGHFFASFLSRDAAHDLLMAAWRKSYPCSANAHGISSNNIYLRSNRSNGTFNNNSNGNNDDNDNDYDDDTQSFISARTGTLDSRRNRHRRSSSSSQNWTADEAEWDETEDMDEYVAAATTGAKLASSKAPRRRGSKRGVVKKILKDVIAPGQGDDDGSTSDSKRSGGRGRSVSELPPKPSSLDSVSGFGAATESDGTRASNETDGQSSGAVRPRPRVVGGSDSRVPRLASSRIGTLPANIRSISPSKSQAISKGTANGAVTANGSNTAATTTRTPTTCKCSKDGRHYANQFMSETYPGTVEKIWKLLFDSDFNKSFLTSDVMRGADLQDEAWQKSPTDKTLTKTTRYTKWLGLPIGPKTTKATLVDVCEHQDFDDYVTTVTTSSTPDVPSGSSFTAKNRTCITWAGPGLVQVVVTGGVEFTKSSWIKGQIEKGAFDGMTTHYKELNLALRKHIAAHSEEFGAAANGAGAASARVKDLDVKEGSDAGSVSGGRTSKNRQKGRTQGPEAERDRAKAAEAAAAAAAATAALANKGFGAGVNASKTSSDSKGGVLGVLLGLLEPLASLWSSGSSTLSTMATSGKQTGTGLLPLEADSAWSQVAVLSVLVLVMFANIYIWFLISSVTSQIERIQGDVFVQTHGGGADSRYFQGRGRQPYRSPQYMWTGHQEDSMQGGLDGDENEEFGSDSGLTGDMFTREQEEAMWAWLTEREDRHRQHQQHRGSGSRQKQKPRPKMTKPKQPEEGDVDGDEGKGGDRNDKSDQHQALAKDIDQFAETEDRLRARIRELQDQVESLEKAATGSQ